MSDEQIVAQLADLTVTPIDESVHTNTGYYYSGNYVYLTPPQIATAYNICLLYTSPSPRDGLLSRMPSSA